MLFRRLTYTENTTGFCLLLKRTVSYRTVFQNVEKVTEKRMAVSTQSSATPNAAHGYRADKAKTKASVDPPLPAQAHSPKHKKNASKQSISTSQKGKRSCRCRKVVDELNADSCMFRCTTIETPLHHARLGKQK